jgi:hypothetical protein
LGLDTARHQIEFGQERSFRANSWGNRLEKAPKVLEAIIVALPETAGSALYGMVDVLAATGTLWRRSGTICTALITRGLSPSRRTVPLRE